MDNTVGAPGASGNAGEQVRTPAILLMVVGAVTIVAALFGLVQNLTGGSAAQIEEALNSAQIPEDMRPLISSIVGMGPLLSLLQAALGAIVLFGGLKMKSLASYGLAMAASIVALIPCCGSWCCVGIPVGIWALVVLSRPEVKSAFPRS